MMGILEKAWATGVDKQDFKEYLELERQFILKYIKNRMHEEKYLKEPVTGILIESLENNSEEYMTCSVYLSSLCLGYAYNITKQSIEQMHQTTFEESLYDRYRYFRPVVGCFSADKIQGILYDRDEEVWVYAECLLKDTDNDISRIIEKVNVMGYFVSFEEAILTAYQFRIVFLSSLSETARTNIVNMLGFVPTTEIGLLLASMDKHVNEFKSDLHSVKHALMEAEAHQLPKADLPIRLDVFNFIEMFVTRVSSFIPIEDSQLSKMKGIYTSKL